MKQAILSHLASHIGQLTPTNVEMAHMLGCTESAVDRHISMLKAEGAIFTSGQRSSRYFNFRDHEGHTLPRVGKVHPAPPAMVEGPVYDRPQACPRCQVRGCTRHSAAYLVTSVAKPAWAHL